MTVVHIVDCKCWWIDSQGILQQVHSVKQSSAGLFCHRLQIKRGLSWKVYMQGKGRTVSPLEDFRLWIWIKQVNWEVLPVKAQISLLVVKRDNPIMMASYHRVSVYHDPYLVLTPSYVYRAQENAILLPTSIVFLFPYAAWTGLQTNTTFSVLNTSHSIAIAMHREHTGNKSKGLAHRQTPKMVNFIFACPPAHKKKKW